MYISYNSSIHPVISSWALELLLDFGYNEYCSNEYRDTNWARWSSKMPGYINTQFFFLRYSYYFLKEVKPVHFPTNYEWGFLFSIASTLTLIDFVLCVECLSKWCKVIIHCCSDLHFPVDK